MKKNHPEIEINLDLLGYPCHSNEFAILIKFYGGDDGAGGELVPVSQSGDLSERAVASKVVQASRELPQSVTVRLHVWREGKTLSQVKPDKPVWPVVLFTIVPPKGWHSGAEVILHQLLNVGMHSKFPGTEDITNDRGYHLFDLFLLSLLALLLLIRERGSTGGSLEGVMETCQGETKQ